MHSAFKLNWIDVARAGDSGEERVNKTKLGELSLAEEVS